MCPCESQKKFEECCGPFLSGEAWPKTAEQLMRSRYSAFARGEVGYIKKTSGGAAAKEFNEAEARKWSQNSDWLGLKILSTTKGQESDSTGTVEFIAKYTQEGQTLEHHEVSQFKKDSEGHWLFIDGESHIHEEGQGHHHPPVQPVVRQEPKVGRNDPCPCGSGKKYKKCCGE